MASRIIKIQVCDRCQMEQRADTVTEMPPGWGRLVRQGASKQPDLCPTCVAALMPYEGTKRVETSV